MPASPPIRADAGPPLRVGVVGSGVSGLACAAALHDAGHEVEVLEASDHVGGHVRTIDVDLDGASHRIDVGFIVFNDVNYPGFRTLIDRLGVTARESTMSFAVSCERTGIEYTGTGLGGMLARRRNALVPSHWRMIADIVRWHREAPALLGDDAPGVHAPATEGDGPRPEIVPPVGRDAAGAADAREDEGVADWARAHGYSEAFLERYLVPMGSAIWSCGPGTFRSFPVRFVAAFMANHRMLQVAGRPAWRTIEGGSRTYVDALVRPFRDAIRTGVAVQSIRRRSAGVEVLDGRGHVRAYDEIVLACHADEALALLDDPSPVERDLLGAFPYAPNDVVLHHDASVLPRTRRAWSAWNYRRPREEPERLPATYCMNILQGIRSPHVFCVTLNDDDSIDPARVIGRWSMSHPVYTARRLEVQRRHDELVRANRTSYCGAYWGWGFHEDGYQSGRRVAAAFPAVERVPAPRTAPAGRAP